MTCLEDLWDPQLQKLAGLILIRHHCLSTEQKWLTLELCNICRTGSGTLTSVERPPALCIVRSSHGAASWSLIWAVAEGLPESWLSSLRVGEAMLSPLSPGCRCCRIIPRRADGKEQNEAIVQWGFTPDLWPCCSNRTRLWQSLPFWYQTSLQVRSWKTQTKEKKKLNIVD